LFSGIGAFSLAAKRAGLRTTYFSEINDFAVRVLRKNFPQVGNLGNVQAIEGEWLREFVGVDLVTGGFPCTDLSQASKGSHLGLEGTESGLFWEMARIIWEVDPRWVIIENVPQVLSYQKAIEDEFPFLELEGGLFEAGEYGANCRRRRAFLVGSSEPGGARQVFNLVQSHRTPVRGGGEEDVFPMLLPWKGGLSLERLGSCLVELPAQEADATRIRESDGLSRGVDGRRYLALGNSIVPIVPELIMQAILSVEAGMESVLEDEQQPDCLGQLGFVFG
jgi:DNA (cytosine-5)-methyltransferase 1